MKIKKIYYSLQTIFDILLAKNLYLINSPQNYLSLVEYLKINNIKDNKVKIIAGFPSDNSIRQIQKIHSSEVGIKNELVFLKERFKKLGTDYDYNKYNQFNYLLPESSR